MEVILFGSLAEIAGSNVRVDNAADTASLVKKLHAMFPAMATSKYMIAVDKQIVHTNTLLNEHSVVALLPPFSGG